MVSVHDHHHHHHHHLMTTTLNTNMRTTHRWMGTRDLLTPRPSSRTFFPGTLQSARLACAGRDDDGDEEEVWKAEVVEEEGTTCVRVCMCVVVPGGVAAVTAAASG